MSDQWFVQREGKRIGPISSAKLRQLAASGKLKPTDLVQKEGMSKSVPASAIKGLLASAGTPPDVASHRAGPVEDRRASRDIVAERNNPAADVGHAPQPSVPTRADPPPPVAAFAPPDVAAGESAQHSARSIKRIAMATAALLVVAAREFRQHKARSIKRIAMATAALLVVAMIYALTSRSGSALSRSSLPADYVRLAMLIADPYSREEGKWTESSALKEIGDVDAALESVYGTKIAALRPAVDALAAGRERAEITAKAQQQRSEKAESDQKDVQERAARGDYVREVEEQKVVRYDHNGNPVYETVRQRVDESDTPLVMAFVGRKLAGTSEGAKQQIRSDLEKFRMQAWQALLPKLGEIYGKSPARNNLVTARIAAADPGKSRCASFAVVNSAGKLLTDVTLVIDLLHFTDAPNVSSRQVLFLPEWPADQHLYLNTEASSNMIGGIVGAKSRGRPVTARPGWAMGRDSGIALMGVAGVVESRVTVWAAEAHQPEQAVKYPEVVVAGARFEMEVLNAITEYELVEQLEREAAARNRFQFRRPPSILVPGPEVKRTSSPSNWLLGGASHMSELVPGTELEREAQALLADPVGVIRQRRQKRFDSLTQAITVGRQWTGTWTFEMTDERPSAGMAIGAAWMFGAGTPPGGEKVAELLKTRVGSNGPIALTFEAAPAPAKPPPKGAKPPAADPKPPLIYARIFNPEQPSAYQPLIGEINNNDEKHIILRMITQPTSGPNGQTAPIPPRPKRDPSPAGQCTLENDDLSLQLICDGGDLTGMARTTADRYHPMYGFALVLKK